MNNPNIEFHGPTATHDQPCAVYHDQPAVLDMNKGVFEPSWKAQADGWCLVKANTPLKALIVKIFFGVK